MEGGPAGVSRWWPRLERHRSEWQGKLPPGRPECTVLLTLLLAKLIPPIFIAELSGPLRMKNLLFILPQKTGYKVGKLSLEIKVFYLLFFTNWEDNFLNDFLKVLIFCYYLEARLTLWLEGEEFTWIPDSLKRNTPGTFVAWLSSCDAHTLYSHLVYPNKNKKQSKEVLIVHH